MGQKNSRADASSAHEDEAHEPISTLLKVNVKAGGKVLRGKKQVQHLLLEITTSKRKAERTRPPTNLALVLDKSGSMSGAKIVNSREAVKKVLDMLGDHDRLHLVKYSTGVSTVFENATVKSRSKLKAKVDGINVDGSTNLSGGLQRGFNLCKAHARKGVVSNRVFLFSDGQPNHGITDQSGLFELAKGFAANGVNVTTFGIGADYNEPLMRGLAESGSGDYFFIDKAENILSLVDKGMNRAIHLVGVNASLSVEGVGGVVVTRVLGYETTSLIRIGDIMEDEVRQILVEVEIPGDEAAPADKEGPTQPSEGPANNDDDKHNEAKEKGEDGKPQEEGDKRKEGGDGGEEEDEGLGSLDLLRWELKVRAIKKGDDDFAVSGTAAAVLTNNPAKAQEKDSQVQVSLKIAEVAVVDDKVARLLEQGRVAEAKEAKTAVMDSLRELEKVDYSGLVAKVVKRSEELLERMEVEHDTNLMAKDAQYLYHQANLQCSGLM